MIEIVVPAAIMQLCEVEAADHAPRETGGLFLGRTNGQSRLVEHVIGAGPAARRTRRWLEVDHDYQNAEIARIATIDEHLLYVGEWHSHPAAHDATLSWTDRRAMAKLAAFKALRCPDPVMMIFYRRGKGWAAGAWQQSEQLGIRLIPPSVARVDIVVARAGRNHDGTVEAK